MPVKKGTPTPAKAIQLEDDGMIVFELGGEVSEPLDLYKLHTQLIEKHAEAKKLPPEQFGAYWFDGVLDIMEASGLGRGSYRVAEQFASAVFGAVKNLKNASGGEPTQGSPATTAPASSAPTGQPTLTD